MTKFKKFVVKFKAWAKTAGLRSFAYLGAGIAAKILLGSGVLLGVGIGIFLADNWVTIRELIKTKAEKLIDVIINEVV